MTNLVTGGLGFLGSHLVEQLLLEDQGTIRTDIVDNLSSNVVDKDFFNNVWSVATNTTDFLKNYPDQYDRIYHLAGPVGPAGVIPHTGDIASSIIRDAKMVATQAIAWNAEMLYVSTSEVYGGGQNVETEPCTVTPDNSPRLEYAIGKLAAEVMLRNLAQYKGLKLVIVRPFNIAGPRQSEKGGFVIPRFIQSALKDEPITVFGDGSALRAFTHAKDISSGLVKLMDALSLNQIDNAEVFNLGNAGSKVTIVGLAKKIIELTKSKSEINYVDPKTIFGEHYVEAPDKLPNAAKAMDKVGWVPKYDLDTLLEQAVNWELSK